jgi:hypothetical protein
MPRHTSGRATPLYCGVYRKMISIDLWLIIWWLALRTLTRRSLITNNKGISFLSELIACFSMKLVDNTGSRFDSSFCTSTVPFVESLLKRFNCFRILLIHYILFEVPIEIPTNVCPVPIPTVLRIFQLRYFCLVKVDMVTLDKFGLI